MNEMREMRRSYQWKMDNVNAEIQREVADMADDAKAIAEAIKNEWNINGFEHTRGSRGSKLDSLIAKRALLAEVIGGLDYNIKALEAEEASS